MITSNKMALPSSSLPTAEGVRKTKSAKPPSLDVEGVSSGNKQPTPTIDEGLNLNEIPKEILQKRANIETKPIKPRSVSTASGYQSWGLAIKGKQLFLNKKGEQPLLVKEGSHEELNAIKQLLKPKGVIAYEASQQANGNCGLLAALQEMMLTGNRLEDLIKAIGYNPKDKSWSMTYLDKNNKPKRYNLSEVQLLVANINEDFTVAFSPTHQDLNSLVEMTLRHAVYDNSDADKVKKRQPYDPRNSEGSVTLLQKMLNPSVQKTTQSLGVEKGELVTPKETSYLSETFTIKQLAKQRKENPNRTIVVSIISATLDEKGKPMRTPKGELVVNNSLEKQLKAKGLVSQHAYTLLSANEEKGTISIVNPYDSSKAIVLDATSLFFNYLLLAKNKTGDGSVQSSSSDEVIA